MRKVVLKLNKKNECANQMSVCSDKAAGSKIASLPFYRLTQKALLKLCNLCLFSAYELNLAASVMGCV